MRQCIRMLIMVLFLVVGTAPVVLASGGHGGYHRGGHHQGGHHQGGHHGGGHHRGWHHRGYGSGIYYDVSPLWIAPEPSYVAPTLWYYCTDPPGYYPTVPTCNVPWTLVYSQG